MTFASPVWLLWTHTTILFTTCVQSTIFMLVVVAQYLYKRFVHKPPPPLDEYPAISVIVPCYLPNEASIIQLTLEHILKLDYPGELTLWCVYNMPDPMPEEEAELRRFAAGPMPAGRKLKLVNSSAYSSSKAENLNIIISQLSDPLVSVYDADHRPYQNALRLLVETLTQKRADCVQGSIAIRTRPDLLAKLVCAETFAQQFVYFPMAAAICDTGFYGGSNAVWRTETLRKYHFRKRMLTEDIDLSSRSIFDGKRLVLCPEARSSELPTADIFALWKQRRRWAIGWDQVALQTARLAWSASRSSKTVLRDSDVAYVGAGPPWRQSGTPVEEFSWTGKLRVVIMFPVQRWFIFFLTFFVAIISPALSLAFDLTEPSAGPVQAFSMGMRVYVFVAMGLIVCCALGHTAMHEPSAAHWWYVLLFYCIAPPYALWNFSLLFISLFSIATGQVGDWYVTLRAVNSELSLEQLEAVQAKIDQRTRSTADLHGLAAPARRAANGNGGAGNGTGHLNDPRALV